MVGSLSPSFHSLILYKQRCRGKDEALEPGTEKLGSEIPVAEEATVYEERYPFKGTQASAVKFPFVIICASHARYPRTGPLAIPNHPHENLLAVLVEMNFPAQRIRSGAFRS